MGRETWGKAHGHLGQERVRGLGWVNPGIQLKAKQLEPVDVDHTGGDLGWEWLGQWFGVSDRRSQDMTRNL